MGLTHRENAPTGGEWRNGTFVKSDGTERLTGDIAEQVKKLKDLATRLKKKFGRHTNIVQKKCCKKSLEAGFFPDALTLVALWLLVFQ